MNTSCKASSARAGETPRVSSVRYTKSACESYNSASDGGAPVWPGAAAPFAVSRGRGDAKGSTDKVGSWGEATTKYTPATVFLQLEGARGAARQHLISLWVASSRRPSVV